MLFGPRPILLIGDHGVMLLSSSADGFHCQFADHQDAAARDDIMTALSASKQHGVEIVYNGAKQDMKLETLPPAHVVDRHKLAARRAAQNFSSALAVAYRLAGRDLLIGSLQPVPEVMTWLRHAQDFHIAIALAPIELGRFLAAVLPESSNSWAMLLARFRTGGLRQIVTRNGSLIFSRLLPEALVEQDSGLVAVVEDTRSYLARYGLGPSVNLYILIMQDVESRQEQEFPPNCKVTRCTPQQAAQKAGIIIGVDAGEGGVDAVCTTYLFFHKKRIIELLPHDIAVRQRDRLLQKVGRCAAALAMIVAWAMVGSDTLTLSRQSIDLAKQEKEIEYRRQRLLADESAMSQGNLDLARLREALHRQRLFGQVQPAPWPALQAMGHVLDDTIRVTGLSWTKDQTLRVVLTMTDAAVNVAANRGDIVKNYDALAKNFAAALPGYSVHIIHYPFPATAYEILTNSEDDTAGAKNEAEFSLRKMP